MVDAPSEVAAERSGAVIPPTKVATVFCELAKDILKTELQNVLQRFALRVRGHDVSCAFFGIVNVLVFQGNIEIAANVDGFGLIKQYA